MILLKKARQEKKVKRYLEDNFRNREGKIRFVLTPRGWRKGRYKTRSVVDLLKPVFPPRTPHTTSNGQEFYRLKRSTGQTVCEQRCMHWTGLDWFCFDVFLFLITLAHNIKNEGSKTLADDRLIFDQVEPDFLVN